MRCSVLERTRRRADIEAQLVVGGVERNPGPRRRGNRGRPTTTTQEDFNYDTYASTSDDSSYVYTENVLGMQQWGVVAHTPAAVPQEELESGTGRRRRGRNAAARFRGNAAHRSPRAELREMPYTDDGRPAWTSCAQRQVEMFDEMTEYTRYDRDGMNFEVWVAKLFADYMSACEAEMRRISLMKEELVVWALRAALMADAYDISMFHISFCPVGGCRDFRETRELLEQHILDTHPSSQHARRLLAGDGYDTVQDWERRGHSNTTRPPPTPEVGRSTATPSAPRPQQAPAPAHQPLSPSPSPQTTWTSQPGFDGATNEQLDAFEILRTQLCAQYTLLERIERNTKRKQTEVKEPSLIEEYAGRLREITVMWAYVRDQRSEIIYEESLARCHLKPRLSVAQVLSQMTRVVGEQQLILDQIAPTLLAQ